MQPIAYERGEAYVAPGGQAMGWVGVLAINSAVPEGLKEFHVALGEALDEFAKTHPEEVKVDTTVLDTTPEDAPPEEEEEYEYVTDEEPSVDSNDVTSIPPSVSQSSSTEAEQDKTAPLTHPLAAEMYLDFALLYKRVKIVFFAAVVTYMVNERIYAGCRRPAV
ncbi:hypothetical protein HDV00_005990 [Rhizophlyctis rosea]|nr:hypothetical protein HDV00_005990 [Rhizophlyctis rosea]